MAPASGSGEDHRLLPLMVEGETGAGICRDHMARKKAQGVGGVRFFLITTLSGAVTSYENGIKPFIRDLPPWPKDFPLAPIPNITDQISTWGLEGQISKLYHRLSVTIISSAVIYFKGPVIVTNCSVWWTCLSMLNLKLWTFYSLSALSLACSLIPSSHSGQNFNFPNEISLSHFLLFRKSLDIRNCPSVCDFNLVYPFFKFPPHSPAFPVLTLLVLYAVTICPIGNPQWTTPCYMYILV